jgi:phosphatidylglycerophosphate synthase
VQPNTITAFSLLFGLAAGAAFVLAHHGRLWFLAGGLLVALSGMADSLDGIVARQFGSTSRWGDFLDHFCDRLVNLAIFVGLAFAPGASAVLGLSAVILILLNSYLGTQIEASFGRRWYGGLGKAELFVVLVAVAVLLAFLPATAWTVGGRTISLLNLLFLILGLSSLVAMGQRFRFALRIAADLDGDGPR